MEKTNIKLILTNIKEQPNLWGSIIPMQIFAIWAIVNILSGSAPSWWWIASIVGYVCIMMLGISACYHRLLSHRGYEVHPWLKRLMLWFAAIAGQGGPIFWCVTHRGYHHRFTDKPGDPHSPKDGFWHSYILWMFKLRNGDLSPKSCVDLLRDPDCLFVHNHYQKILWISHLVVALISVDLWLYTMALPAFITLHSFALQTSLNHSQQYGYTNYSSDNDSKNVVWLFPLILGEAWHNNHHGDAKNPNYGHRHWFELDPTYYLIKLISKKVDKVVE